MGEKLPCIMHEGELIHHGQSLLCSFVHRDASGSYAETQKATAIRKAYHV